MKRAIRDESLSLNWRQSRRVCLNPSPDMTNEEEGVARHEEGRSTNGGGDNWPIGSNRAALELALAAAAKRGESSTTLPRTRQQNEAAIRMKTNLGRQAMVVKCEQNRDVKHKAARSASIITATQQEGGGGGDPVITHHETSLNHACNEGVLTAKNLPQKPQQQRPNHNNNQWQQQQPVVAPALPLQARSNNGRAGAKAAKEGASSSCGRLRATNDFLHHNQQQSAKRQQQQFVGDEKHPLDAASLISKLFFGWMFPIVYRGWRFGLELADLPKQSSAADSCHKIGEELVANWNKQLASCNRHHLSGGHSPASGHGGGGGGLYGEQQVGGGRKPSLVRAVLRTHAKWILFNSSITLFSEVICKSLSAYSVGQMLELMSQREIGDCLRVWSLEEPLVCWTLTLILSLGLWVLSAHFYGFQMMRVGLHVRVGCSYLIYRKSLRLGQFESSQKTMGKMINLMTNDLDKFNYVFILLPYIWIGPIQCAVSVYLLWPSLGPASMGALLVVSAMLPIHFYLGSKFAKYRRRIATITDERVRLLDETIGALKLIKLYAWEYPMRGAMHEVRRRETSLINRVSIIKATSSALMFVSSKLVLFVTILLHCSVFGASLNAKILFVSMALLNNIQFTMCQMMPRAVGLWVESLVSLGRIGNFLLSSEFEPSSRLTFGEGSVGDLLLQRQPQPQQDYSQIANHLLATGEPLNAFAVSIDYANVSARWPDATTNTLERVTFKCQSAGLMAICGQMASGKSSLLLTMLNELPISGGTARLVGTCGYASQKAWIFNGTVRENIVFGGEFDEQRYEQVLDVCALKRDLELLDCADLTYIQANSLSGGQQARVNLARCLYRRCDIYLLDDPFSALDGPVAEHIFERAIRKFLSNKLVLLCTNHVGMLKQSDTVLLLDGGKQLAHCGFTELCRKLTSAAAAAQPLGGKCFSDEQLQRLSFLVDGLNDSAGRPAAVAADDDDKSNSRISCDNRNCCEVSLDGIIDNGGSDSENHRDGQVLSAGTSSAAAAAAPTSTSASKKDVPDGKSLRTISAAGNTEEGANNNQAGLFACSAAAADSEPCFALQPEALSGSVAETVPYGCSREGNTCNSISSIEPSGAEAASNGAVVAASAASGHEQGGAAIMNSSQHTVAQREDSKSNSGSRLNNNDSKVDSISNSNENGRQWTMNVAHYRTSANNVQQCNLAGALPALSTVIKASDVTTKQALEVNKDTVGSGYEKDDNGGGGGGGVGGGKSRNGPADEKTSVDSNKLPGLHVWYKYYTQTSVIRLLVIILTFLITQALFSTVDIYLTVWSLVEQNRALVGEITIFDQQQLDTFKQHHHQRQKFDYGDGGAVRMPATTTVNGSIIEYDLMAHGGGKLARPMLARLHRGVDEMMVREIENISPLSSRSSSEPLMAVVTNSSFVPGLVYISGHVDSIIADEVEGGSSETISTQNFIQIHNSPPATFTSHIDPKVKQGWQVIHPNINYYNDNLASAITTTSLVDQNIRKQSDEALNVKSIYRPFYLLASNFTSEHQFQITHTILLILLFLASTITNILAFTSSTKSAKILYGKLIDNALFAKLSFFDTNPSGRLLNRATRDIGIIDETIPMQAQQAYELLLRTVATFIMVAATDFNLALPSLVILFFFLIYHSISVKPTKDIQRLEGILRSPIISHISTSLDGLHTIRASKSEHRFEQLFLRHQDENSSVFLLQIGCNRSTAIVLDCLSTFYTSLIALWAVVSGLTGPAAGLIVTSAMLLSGLTSHGILKLTETESLMTSVERVIEYCNLPQEDNYDTTAAQENGCHERGAHGKSGNCTMIGGKRQPPRWLTIASMGNYNITTKQQTTSPTSGGGGGSGWPNSGSVEYRHVDFYYNNKLEKPVLKNISFRLQSGEKVAIVGRTGAGKSSIIATLFRLYDFNGTILIDGVDINNIDLIRLRSAIGVIPQSPVLFSTTIRANLDPFNVFDDFALWSALEKAHLRETVAALPGKLDYDIGSGGLSFSCGQKQLICLARVLLRQSRLIVMDEATANVDPNTDSIIQATIRRQFKHCTVITIAHRLETILDYDRVMVLEAGRIVDFDTPERLASKKDGFFASRRRHLINNKTVAAPAQ